MCVFTFTVIKPPIRHDAGTAQAAAATPPTHGSTHIFT